MRRLPFVALLAAVVVGPRPAQAIPVFAHRFGLSCAACHTTVPHLTAFGEAFLERGYRLAGTKPAPAFPVALRANLQYGSEAQAGLPKAVVDEVELLAGGALGTRGSYFAEQYLVDGGVPGRTRDIWAAWRVTPPSGVPVTVRGGQFTLDLPLDPETFRETTDHYAIWDQTAGDNPFAFFAPKMGLSLTAGSAGRGLRGGVALIVGHEPGSGLPARGIDRHIFVQQQLGNAVLSAYRYDGTRPVDGENDRFWREGYGAGLTHGRARLDAVYQRGYDIRADAAGALRTSGGFVQARYEASSRLFALARYDATQSRDFARALIAGAGYRIARNARLSVFDTLHFDAATGAHRNSLSTALLFAY